MSQLWNKGGAPLDERVLRYTAGEDYALFAPGETSKAVTGAGGSVRPTPSPDGKKIAFVRRERARSKLYVKDLVSGEERKVYDALDQDVQETWAVTGVYPNMAWTPDSKKISFVNEGRIYTVPIGTE